MENELSDIHSAPGIVNGPDMIELTHLQHGVHDVLLTNTTGTEHGESSLLVLKRTTICESLSTIGRCSIGMYSSKEVDRHVVAKCNVSNRSMTTIVLSTYLHEKDEGTSQYQQPFVQSGRGGRGMFFKAIRNALQHQVMVAVVRDSATFKESRHGRAIFFTDDDKMSETNDPKHRFCCFVGCKVRPRDF